MPHDMMSWGIHYKRAVTMPSKGVNIMMNDKSLKRSLEDNFACDVYMEKSGKYSLRVVLDGMEDQRLVVEWVRKKGREPEVVYNDDGEVIVMVEACK